jgi:hypothetical protein
MRRRRMPHDQYHHDLPAVRRRVRAGPPGHRRCHLALVSDLPASAKRRDPLRTLRESAANEGTPALLDLPRSAGAVTVPSPEPQEERNAAIPEGEPVAMWTAAAVLEQARALASTLDPPRAAIYRSMPLSRWLQAVDLASKLLTADAAHRLRGRGRGRRQHAAEIHGLLVAANAGNVVAALAMMLVMGRLVDQVPRGT